MLLMNITAVIVTYNRLEKLKMTIERSLQEDIDKIIIINNNSTDGTAAYLDSLQNERIITRHLDQNIGGAGGFHVGFDIAVSQTNAEWILCYDDDAYPQPGAVKKFKSLDLPRDTVATAAAVYLPDGRVSVMNRVRINPFKNLRNFWHTYVKKNPIYISESAYAGIEPLPIDASTFVGFFIKTEVIPKVGLPRRELFIYADDLIYTLGLTMNGYKHLFIPSVKFTHDCDTLLGEQDVYHPIWKVYFTYRNRIEMYRVSIPALYIPIALIQSLSWIGKKRHYPDQKLFLLLLKEAILDAFKSDFSKSLEDIQNIIRRYNKS